MCVPTDSPTVNIGSHPLTAIGFFYAKGYQNGLSALHPSKGFGVAKLRIDGTQFSSADVHYPVGLLIAGTCRRGRIV